jgi:hypothetical protein
VAASMKMTVFWAQHPRRQSSLFFIYVSVKLTVHIGQYFCICLRFEQTVLAHLWHEMGAESLLWKGHISLPSVLCDII